MGIHHTKPVPVKTSSKSTDIKTPSSFEPVSVQVFATPSPKVAHKAVIANNHTPATISTASTSTSSISTPDLNAVTCKGCGNTRYFCHEVKYTNFGLHAVIDYFELVGMDFATQHGIHNAFTVAYTSFVKKDMLERHDFYKRSKEIEMTDCIEQGALQEAYHLRNSHCLLQFLTHRRVYDIPQHLQDVADGRAEKSRFPDNEIDDL